MNHASRLMTALLLAIALMTAASIQHNLAGLSLDSLWEVSPTNWQTLLLQYSWAPRQAVALIAGALLGLSGCLMQQCLRNPLASPSTLGVSAGAQLSLTLATLYAPSLLVIGRNSIAIIGALAAAALALALASRRQFSPLAVVLAGLLLSLYCGAASSALLLMRHDQLASVFIWGGGSLVQNGWQSAQTLALTLAAATLGATVLIRPLSLLSLGEQAASALGVRLGTLRIATLTLAAILSAIVVAEVGVIGFIGLAAPALARLCGCNRFGHQLLWSPLLGALTLWGVDLCLQLVGPISGSQIPTGAVTGLFGAPLLMLLLARLPKLSPQLETNHHQSWHHPHPQALVFGAMAFTILATLAALYSGFGLQGWSLDNGELLPWRWPRVTAAGCAGLLLAASGVIMQRLLANPMASPELLGVSSGAAIGIAVVMIGLGTASLAAQLMGATFGALIALGMIIALSHRVQYQASHLILAGIALTALMEGLAVLMTASGDPRAVALMSWLSGSTYRVSPSLALSCALAAALLLMLVLIARRPLQAIALGDSISRNSGFAPNRSRLALLILVAACSAAATLAVGPMSFVSLMAPHIARQLGAASLQHQLILAMPIGMALLISADWVGRYLIYPWQLPAGLVTTLLGGPYLLWLMLKRN
ncbi:Fe(3+)-hydroxamate ABC transporter permease FhuB [Ferrimonas aestuarii]|uniref:Fe(3+)-hydroxamate ABC transporter permease FhuB n=1 Tax=Ferrimonas aestuarii TaxID=2569539 RepID=A0A4U1BFP1_9GAMM|nr:Fe(3+)-hydroxamate ABC transporter permease FhuB [Ferrimonas aestuarii]TKB50113.1 Fe(3+)-hydroxamate ABC transporter permease FhuB [Ferrimonas aestuarii]